MENELRLPNGGTLYWEENKAGGRSYFTDEVGNGVLVWDTAIIDISTLLTAITTELEIIKKK